MDLEFHLPVGYVDERHALHQTGTLRMARAIDEIDAMAHPRVRANEAYLPVAVLAQVVTRLGDVDVTEEVIGRLPLRDFQFLERLYLRFNGVGDATTSGTLNCPHCASSLLDPPRLDPEPSDA